MTSTFLKGLQILRRSFNFFLSIKWSGSNTRHNIFAQGTGCNGERCPCR